MTNETEQLRERVRTMISTCNNQSEYEKAACDLMEDLLAAIPDSELLDQFVLGRFTIGRGGIPEGAVSIYCNGDGEGGTFSEKALEKAIGDFYAKNF